MPPEASIAIQRWFATHTTLPVRLHSHATRLEELCGQVAGAALVVSTDTALVHLADAFDVPTLAFFPTHDPRVRVRDYPLCHAIRLHAPGLPDAPEFPRDDRDIAAAQAAWFPLDCLDAALTAATTRHQTRLLPR